MFFQDRTDAARQLLPHLSHFRGQEGVVLAIPRGGVPIGAYLAAELKFQLDLLMTKKIGHPANPEFAIGAVGLEDSIIDIKHEMLRNKQPRRLIVAVPVAPPPAAARIRESVDELICLHTPPGFTGISQFYADFSQVEDEDVRRLLATV